MPGAPTNDLTPGRPELLRALGRNELAGAAWRALVLAVAAALVGFAYNHVRSDRVALTGYSPPTSCTGEAEATAVTAISASEVASLCGDRDVVVADVRPPERFEQGHVAGAIHLPCSASNDAARVADTLLEGKRMLVVYGETSDDARPVAESLLRRRGDKPLEVRVLEGGFSAWFQGGFACSSGPCDDCQKKGQP